MLKKRAVLLVGLILVVMLVPLSFVFAQLPIEEFNTLRVSGTGQVDVTGNMHLELSWKFPTNALYIEIKRNYPNPYVILREFSSQRAAFEVANAQVEYDDANRKLHIKADVLGAAINKRGRWEVDIGKGTDLIFMEKQRAIFLEVTSTDSQFVQIMDTTIQLPEEASNIKYDETKGLLAYSLPEKSATGYCELSLSLKYKPRLMAATYKIYSNLDAANGSMWVVKSIFKNSGESNIRNLKISYKLGEYSDWSIPKTYSLVVPGGYVVDLYYPVLSSNVTKLATRTPVDVQIEYSYQDEQGNTYSDIYGERIEILGINQMEFCNLSMEERTGSWADNFSNAPLLAAWVTHLDAPVKALAGMVSRLAGGVPTALDQQAAIQFCRALYELQIANGMAYQTPSGFLQDYVPGQDVKYPRDVLRDKSGTCVDLAILYASVCEAVGLKTMLVVIPGHAFPVVILPGGGLLPVECTGISGAAVGEPQVKAISFDKAVELGSKQLQQLQVGMYYTVDVQKMWQQGVVSPELPLLDANILERWGWQLGQVQIQTQPTTDRGTEAHQAPEPVTPPPTTTTSVTQKYSADAYKFSFLYPETWSVKEEQGAVNVNEPQNLAWITMFRTQNEPPQALLENVESQLKQNWQNYTVTRRGEVKINLIDSLRVDGEATSQGQVWVFTLLVLHQQNQARLVVGAGVIKEKYANISPLLEKVFNSITLDELTAQPPSPQTLEPQPEPAQPAQRPEESPTPTPQQTPPVPTDGSEGIKLLKDSARGADPLPLPERTPPSDWVHVSHPTIYMLKLIRPPDWKEEIIQDASGYYGGLKIISPEGEANLHVYYSVVFGQVSLKEGIREGIHLLTSFYPEVQFVVEDDLRNLIPAMWPEPGADARFIAFRFQGKVGVLLCMVFPMGGGQATQVHLKGCIGPADNFDELVKDVFYKVFGWVGAGGYITPAPRG